MESMKDIFICMSHLILDPTMEDIGSHIDNTLIANEAYVQMSIGLLVRIKIKSSRYWNITYKRSIKNIGQNISVIKYGG